MEFCAEEICHFFKNGNGSLKKNLNNVSVFL